MAKKAQLKPEILETLRSVATPEQITNLDQSQIYLLSIPSLYKFVLEKTVDLDELSQKNDLCFTRLQKYLNTDLSKLIHTNHISLQALSTIDDATSEIIIKRLDDILDDQDNQIILDILINQTPELWDTTAIKEPISPWNEEIWAKYKSLMPDQVAILDASVLIESPEALPTFSEIINQCLAARICRPASKQDGIENSPFSSTYDQAGGDDFIICSESMLSTSSVYPNITRPPKKLEPVLLQQVYDGQEHTRPRLDGDTLHYYNGVKVKIPENYDFSTEGLTMAGRKK